MFFFRFYFSQILGAYHHLSFHCISGNRVGTLCATTPHPMATDDARQATEAAEF
jgi:hypothetical protein